MKKLLPLLALLAACSDPATADKKPAGEMHKIAELPDFMFQEARGRAIGRKDLLGKVWVVATVFTRCPTHCPAMSQEMYLLQKEFEKDPDFRLVTLSVDPAHDTVEVLDKYAKSYYAKPDRWYFVRHPERDYLRTFVVDGLHIAWDKDEPLNHSYRMVLVDRDGIVRGGYKRTEPGKMEELRDHIRTLLAEKPKS